MMTRQLKMINVFRSGKGAMRKQGSLREDDKTAAPFFLW